MPDCLPMLGLNGPSHALYKLFPLLRSAVIKMYGLITKNEMLCERKILKCLIDAHVWSFSFHLHTRIKGWHLPFAT